MRIGSTCLAVLLPCAVYALLPQESVAADMRVYKASTDNNAHGEQDNGNGDKNCREKKDFSHEFYRLSHRILYLCGANIKRNGQSCKI